MYLLYLTLLNHSLSLSFSLYRKALSFSLKKQLVLSLVPPHFNYASIAFTDLDKTRTSHLQVAHNSYIKLIFGYIAFIPTCSTFTHLNHKRLDLCWLTLSSKRNLHHVMYKTIASHNSDYLSEGLTLCQLNRMVSRPSRFSPRTLDFARTESWKSSFSYSSRALIT